mgnify:CR=1 FL=1
MKRKGFTLIEVLFAAAILTGLLVGTISFFVYCFKMQELSRNTAIAMNEARKSIEEIKSVPFADVISTCNNISNNKRNIAELPLGVRTVTISNVFGSAELYDIQVAVQWRYKRIDGQDMTQNVTLETSRGKK